MAINFTDFSKAPLIDSAAKTIFEDVLKGYKISKEPAKMREEQSQRELATKLKDLELKHKPTEYALGDRQKSLVNSLSELALNHKPKEYDLADAFKQSQIDKNNRPGGGALKPSGDVANQMYIDSIKEQNPDLANRLQRVLDIKQEHTQAGTGRSNVLNETQHTRNSSSVMKKEKELIEINKGVLPGTKTPLTDEQQGKLRSDIMLSIVKDITDPKIREKLINANNMNITLGDINPKALSSYSGIQGKADKIGDAILEGMGEGSKKYQDYIKEVNKANFAAKQMRQYLGDSIQKFSQEKLEKLSRPEAWNVSPKTAIENFEFMRDLYNRESQTLVRAATDPSLYMGTGAKNIPKKDNPIKNKMFDENSPEIIKQQDKFTVIKNNGELFNIPNELVDKFMSEHSGAK